VRGIRENGVVVVDDRGVWIRIVPADDRECASCGACGTAPGRAGVRMLPASAAEGLAPGTEVVVETSPASKLAASLLLLLVPLLGLLAGAVLGRILGPRLGVGPDGGSIVGGLVVLVLVYGAVAAYDRRLRRRSGPAGPRIVEVRGGAAAPIAGSRSPPAT
jgi:positive regulator of sigma E activity